MERRLFLRSSLAAAALPAGGSAGPDRLAGSRVKIALNSYSFNRPLMTGKMNLHDVVDFCAKHNIDGLDATGYYFPGYPNVPADDYIHQLKRRAFLNGVTIGGTGVRNDFALADPSSRRGHIQLVKDWIDAGCKLGASFLRVFAGREAPKGYTFDQVLEWMVPAFQECAKYGEERGILVAIQHHDDFLKTAAETIRLVKSVNSEWFSVVLDVGSLRQHDPYEEIETLLPYACTWQLKEQVWYGKEAAPIDLGRIKGIIDKVGYRGFLPIETLGPGDPMEMVPRFLAKVRQVFTG
jgi:sugar phosphate isomerase/epimerase